MAPRPLVVADEVGAVRAGKMAPQPQAAAEAGSSTGVSSLCKDPVGRRQPGAAPARMSDPSLDIRDRIVAFKRSLAPRHEALKRAYAEATDHVRRAVDAILSDVAAERRVVPEVDYTDISRGTVPETTRRGIR